MTAQAAFTPGRNPGDISAERAPRDENVTLWRRGAVTEGMLGRPPNRDIQFLFGCE